MSQRGGSEGVPLLGAVLAAVAMAIFVTVLKFSQLLNLGLETGSDVLWNLIQVWGLLYLVGLATGFGLRTSWPLGLGLTWWAFMPAFGVWFNEDLYAWVGSWWAKGGALVAITSLGLWTKSL